MKGKYIVIIILSVAVLGVAYYGISPLFRNVKLDEQVPITKTVPSTETEPATPTSTLVTGTLGHPASGNVRIVEADGKSYVRYENFKTINGPDIYVYLAKDLDAKEFVNLGRVKATEGNINYEIPAGVDPREYPYVLTWCKTFGVLFNSAKIY